MIYQTVFDEWGRMIQDSINNADPVAVWGWVLFIIGIVMLFLLIIFTEHKRKERESIKYSVIMVIISSIFLGIGLHLILLAAGFW